MFEHLFLKCIDCDAWALTSGLDEGGVTLAIEIFDCATGLPGAILLNLADLKHNQRRARELAERIVAYREAHPGRPVHDVGYSGGGGLSVLTTEALP